MATIIINRNKKPLEIKSYYGGIYAFLKQAKGVKTQ